MKPYVICHMMSSVDGRILPNRWHPSVENRGVYERLHNELGCDAWLVGRVMGQEFASREGPYPSYTGAPKVPESIPAARHCRHTRSHRPCIGRSDRFPISGWKMKQGVVPHRASIDDEIDCVARRTWLHVLYG